MKPSVLFVCTHNSARSQLAEGLLRNLYGDRFEALSAGTEATQVKPEAAAALREVGIDPSDLFSKTVDDLTGPFDYVVTVCDAAMEACPYVAARSARVHHAFSDPSDVTTSPEERIAAFRKTRDEIRDWLARVFAGAEPDFGA